MESSSCDYPAAHSMDTSWFAIDEAGRVAIFDSGEDGAVPHGALSLGGAGDPDPEATQIAELLAPERDDVFEGGPFFHYGNGDYGDPGRYVRNDHMPTQPANAATLPADLRAKMLRLPVDFTTATTLHLADFMTDEDAQTWGDTTLRGEPRTRLEPTAPNRSGIGWVVVLILALVAALILTAG